MSKVKSITITRAISEKHLEVVTNAGYEQAKDSKGNLLSKKDGTLIFDFGTVDCTDFDSIKEARDELGDKKVLSFITVSTHVEQKKNAWDAIQSELGLKSTVKLDNASRLLDKMKGKATEFDDDDNPIIGGIVFTISDFM